MVDFLSAKKFIISLPKRTDRRALILSQCDKLTLKNYEIFDAIDGKKLPYSGKLKKGQVGCRLSHLEVIKRAKQDNINSIIIIEDDCSFVRGFGTKLSQQCSQIPNNWQMLYFGAHNYRRLKMVSPNIGRCVTTLSTVCYAIHNSIYDLLIEALQQDEILDIIYCNQIHSKINAYCFFPNLVVQANGFSDIENGHINYSQYYSKWE